ncbi:hypothetical protein FIBSPDRAFT_855128 [Athelia psychrophila]|uniref:Uncharacterized protein n=1 Tax=Athelia psychrophila TaxID=1759441 RepID=A0A166PJI5_9AGAM|nr:hypothetical protein FIBSPDRAFT_855128 [Fibularhizoctonia sp. CBS 109695]
MAIALRTFGAPSSPSSSPLPPRTRKGDPLHHLRAWIQNRTLPGGGSRAGELG